MTTPRDILTRFARLRIMWCAVLTGLAVVVMLAVVWGYVLYFPNRLGPEQPIPFSHRVHAGKKEISCYMCHPEAMSGARAGVPSLETCMLCHKHIAIHYPPIERLRSHYFENRPILWKKVNELPDHVHFNHAVHLHRSIDCGHCHGPIKDMDRVKLPHTFTMGWCVGCHKSFNATHDCFSCHR